jgi:signal transduction histidine kinase
MRNSIRFDENRILLEQLRLVFGNFRRTIPVLIVPLLLYWSLSNEENDRSMVWWCVAVISSHLLLQLFARWHYSRTISEERSQKLVWIFAGLNLIDGILWGLLPWLTLDSASQSGFIFVFAVYAGLLGGGLATQSPIPLLFLAFVVPQTVLISIKCWTLDGASFIPLSIGIVVYFITLYGQVINSAIAVRSAIQLRFDLADSHEKLRQIERQQTLDNERQRIMQEMHDGLGSSLISALRVVERGNMTSLELTSVLKGCIDDLKLAIDSMVPVDKNLLLLLATLRFRLGPRLESAGIHLKWQVENIPTLEWLDSRSALHILRILQEAITNIIKHTAATEVQFSATSADDHVVVAITDNGQGFDLNKLHTSTGKGLSGQRDRSIAIGAHISWASGDPGTIVTLLIPIKN